MPGPGGGSRGGGFGSRGGGFGSRGGGGGFGGGHRPGGFHHRPPHHHHHHHHHRPFFFFHRPYYGYGGGCLGGLMGMFLLPFILIIIVISLVVSVFGSIGSSISNVAGGGHFVEDDRVMEEYALREYAGEFGDAVGYEDNILIVFLVDENREDYYTMALVGYNIDEEINNMFGGKYTAYGQTLIGNLNPHYENSLTANLKNTVNTMADKVANLKLPSSFDTPAGSPGDYKSHVTNHSSLEVSEEILNTSLENFTEVTDIPIVIVIDDMDNVFDKSINASDIFTIIFAVGLAGVAVYFIIRAVKENNERTSDEKDDDKNDRSDPDEDNKSNSTSW